MMRRISLGSGLCTLLLAGCSDSPSEPPIIEPDCPALQLAPGQQLILSNSDGLCFGLRATSASEAYLVGVQSISSVLSNLTPVSLSLTPQHAAAPSPNVVANHASLTGTRAPDAQSLFNGDVGRRVERVRDHRRAELQMRARERKHFDLGTRSRRRLDARSMMMTRQAEVMTGDTLTLRIPDRSKDANDADEFCENYIEVRAVARAIGQRAVWLDDVGNPAGGYTTADYQQLSQEFDGTIYPRAVDYFGTPSDIDGNGRILILTTKEINTVNALRPERAILGFVTAADFFPREGADGCAVSNEGEIYYGVSPDPDRVHGWPALPREAYTRDVAMADVRNLVAHEFTHIIQYGRRFTNPLATRLQDTWELEGQAMLAEEVVGHAFTDRSPQNNYGFNHAWTDWYQGHFVDLALYFGLDINDEQLLSKVPGAPEQCSWVALGDGEDDNGPCAGRHVYGVPWSLLRWASDHYGEQTLHRQLIDNVTLSGLPNLAQVTGTPAPTMLAQWAAMLYIDDRVAGAAAPLTLPSWNLHDVFSNLIPATRLQPRERGFTAFSDTLSVRAGSTGYFRLSGANRPVSDVRVSSRAGGALPTHIQLWVVRLQ